MRLPKSKRVKNRRGNRTTNSTTNVGTGRTQLLIFLLLGSLCGITWVLFRPEVLTQEHKTEQSEQQKLLLAEKSIEDIMNKLGGNRFSPKTQEFLQKIRLNSKRSEELFAALSILAFWHLHHQGASEVRKFLSEILSKDVAPTAVAKRMVTLWFRATELMTKQTKNKELSPEDLILEREVIALLRLSFTLREPQRPISGAPSYHYEGLYMTEGKWMIQHVPDHNDKGNTKCLYVPGLLAHEFHPTKRFPGALELERRFPEILAEVSPLLNQPGLGFKSVGGNTARSDGNLVKQGNWTDVSLFSAGVRNPAACALLPRLCGLLERVVPEVTHNVKGHALLSRLEAGTIVNRHHGTSNCQLTMHLGLVVPEHAGIEVNGKRSSWTRGKVLVFDDSYYHSVWHKGKPEDGPRVILLLRGYHPEWTLEERAQLVMTHPDTPLTREERIAETRRLTSPEVIQKWKEHKRLFQYGPPS